MGSSMKAEPLYFTREESDLGLFEILRGVDLRQKIIFFRPPPTFLFFVSSLSPPSEDFKCNSPKNQPKAVRKKLEGMISLMPI